MAIQKSFVIKNGLVVDTDLILADANTNKVGIGTTNPQYTLQVNGGIGVTNAYVSGIATIEKLEVAGLTTTQNLNVSGISTLGVTSATNLTLQQLNISGISTLGVTSATNLTLQQLNISGISTLGVTSTTNLTSQQLNISGISTLGVTSTTNLTSQQLNISGISTIVKLDVGIGGTIISVGLSTYYGNVGIGSTIPQQKLDIAGSVKIDDFIYDSANSSGNNGYYLNMDAGGVRWIAANPNFTQGISIQDDGIYIPTAGLAKTFAVLNFKEVNSLGIGTSTITPIPNPSSPNFISDIQTQDFWGYNSSGNIYRMTNVGINSSNPTVALDITGSANITQTLNVVGDVTFDSTTDSTNKDTGSLIIQGGVGIEKKLNVGGNTKIGGTLELDSSLIDINGSTAIGKTDYRLASVGTGVSWRPSGVQTKRSIWVTLNGDDSNSGLLEGDAKRTIGAGASIAEPGDTVIIRSGVYFENNPIGLRTDVCLSGQDLRLVTVIPNNPTKDVFHVRRGCLIENLSFAGSNISVAHTGAGAVAFPPTDPSKYSLSGYIAPGPATEGETGRWKSPYVRNCTNFMSKSIGMKIDGDHATASTIGANLKSMVLDSFTQYNEAGIGVSITNSGYAQLVSLFTIASDIAVYVDTGGQCDLTNSNSSFGNYGLYAVGVGKTEFTGSVLTATTEETDRIVFTNVRDEFLAIRKPYDGQALFFKLNLDDYNDTVATGITSAPLKRLLKINVINGGSGYSVLNPPDVAIYDINTNENIPLGPEGIIAEVSPTVNDGGSITTVDVVNAGRNYLATQNIGVKINGTPTANLSAVMESIYYTVLQASEPTNVGVTTVIFNEFVPYTVSAGTAFELRRISRILTSGHSFEYIGAGTSINNSTPQGGGVPIKSNEVVALDGAQIPYTSTDQRGNFNIGEGIQINQTTASITGRDFSKAIQAEVTPLILALR